MVDRGAFLELIDEVARSLRQLARTGPRAGAFAPEARDTALRWGPGPAPAAAPRRRKAWPTSAAISASACAASSARGRTHIVFGQGNPPPGSCSSARAPGRRRTWPASPSWARPGSC